MQALVKRTPTNPPRWYQGLELIEKPEPELSPERNVKLEIVSGGICGTDVGIYQGKDSLANAMAKVKQENVTLGHEFCGKILSLHPSALPQVARMLQRRRSVTKPVQQHLHGKSVEQLAADPKLVEFLHQHFFATAEMHFTCGQCLQCRTGHQHVCKNTIGKGMHEDGAFADQMVIPANRLVLIEQGEIPIEIISFMDALGNAVHTAQSADLVGKTVLITGAGVQGLMSCAVARMMGAAKIFVTDVPPKNAGALDKLKIAKNLGADFTFDVSGPEGLEQLRATIAAETDATGVDVAFEMAGHYGAYPQIFDNIRMGGQALFLGFPAGKLEVDFSKEIIFKGLYLHGIYGRRVFDTWDLMRVLLAKGLTDRLMRSGIITHQLPLKDFEKGFAALLNGQAIKVLLQP